MIRRSRNCTRRRNDSAKRIGRQPAAEIKTEDNRRLVLDLLTCEPNGEFTTARIPPGKYLVVAEAYEPAGRVITGGLRRPDFRGVVEVTVPASGQLEPVVIDMRKRSR